MLMGWAASRNGGMGMRGLAAADNVYLDDHVRAPRNERMMRPLSSLSILTSMECLAVA